MTAVLVTGGVGYIGSPTVLALLDAGLTPRVIDSLSTGVREAVLNYVIFVEGNSNDPALQHYPLTLNQCERVVL